MPTNTYSPEILTLAKKHIEIHRTRVARQQDLIAILEQQDDPKRLRSARELLKDMLDALNRLLAEYTAAKNRIDRQKVQKRLG